MADFDIAELCERASVTPRTIYFYVQQGLLPAAGSPGPGARYGQGHVSRIKLIRLLQKQHLPLSEIAKRIKTLSDEQVDALVAETKQRRSDSKGTALDYIRGVLSDPGPPDTSRGVPRVQTRSAITALAATADMMARPAAAAEPRAAPARSQWERYTLADGMELHIRRPLSRIEQKQFERLMAAAREILDESERET